MSSPDNAFIFPLSISIFWMLGITAIFITFLKQLNTQRKRPTVQPNEICIYLALAAFTSFDCCAVLTMPLTIAYYNLKDKSDWDTSITTKWYAMFVVATACLSLLFVLWFYIFRLYESFKNSPMFRVSDNKIKWLIIFSIIIIAGQYWGFLYRIFVKAKHPTKQGRIGLIISMIATLFWVTEYVIITIIFAKKLFQVVITQRLSQTRLPFPSRVSTPHTPHVHHHTHHSTTSSIISSDHLTRRHLVLLNTITKITHLIILPTIGILIFGIVSLIRVYIHQALMLDWIWQLITGAAAVQICLSIWLSFSFANGQYKCLCKHCHAWIQQACIDCAVRRFNAQMDNDINSTYISESISIIDESVLAIN